MYVGCTDWMFISSGFAPLCVYGDVHRGKPNFNPNHPLWWNGLSDSFKGKNIVEKATAKIGMAQSIEKLIYELSCIFIMYTSISVLVYFTESISQDCYLLSVVHLTCECVGCRQAKAVNVFL